MHHGEQEMKKKRFQYIALTTNEQLMVRVLYQIGAAASVYEIFKGMVYRRWALSTPDTPNAGVVSRGQVEVVDAHKSMYFPIMNSFDAFLKKEKLNPGLAAQRLNKEGAGLPSFTTTEAMCEEFAQNGWLGTRTVVVKGKDNKEKTLYFLVPKINDVLRGVFAPQD